MGTPWTDGRLKAFIIAALRAATRRYPPKYECLNEAKTEKKKNPKTNRLAQHYLCASCQQEYPAKEVQVDHIDPVVDPRRGFTTWDDFIERLFCPKANLQVLCTSCHDLKTKKEKEVKSKSQKQLKPKKEPSNSKASSRKKKQTS